MTDVLAAAEAAERVAMGPKVYSTQAQDAKTRRAAEIAYRKAKARPAVRPWTDEVDRLRTAREAHRLSFRTRPAASVEPPPTRGDTASPGGTGHRTLRVCPLWGTPGVPAPHVAPA
ncbi:hypothetical protein ACFQY7_11955 [Actinomadura luteofluorescens]|uniref:hypothetical protein n=1 Tax=Actinomadura luteofluorescens TaxID=46163 RepID=UPI003639DBBF